MPRDLRNSSPPSEDTYSMFFKQLAELTFDKKPIDVFEALSDIWYDATGCKWVWIWLFNELTDRWELISASDKDIQSPRPFSKKSVAEFARLTKQPVVVRDPSTWTDTYDGVEYSAQIRASLEQFGDDSFITVPLFCETEQFSIYGAICLHFSQLSDLEHLLASTQKVQLKTMASLTGVMLLEAYQREAFKILVEFNELTGRHLNILSPTPEEDRRKYLKEISNLIRKNMDVQAVSVFYERPHQGLVECVFSTGLARMTTGKKVPTASLHECTYAPGQGRTGPCYASGQPEFIPIAAPENEAAIFAETNDDGEVCSGPTLLHPIPRQGTGVSASKAAGVVRCVNIRSSQNDARNFQPLEGQVLDFICKQLGPALETFSLRIEREQQISVIQHDLKIPVSTLGNTLEVLIDENREAKPSHESVDYRLLDSQVSAELMKDLVLQLDADPGYFPFDPKIVGLEGDVVAPYSLMLRHFAKESNEMKLVFENIRSIPKIWGDSNLIRRVYFNLVVNAIKYGKPYTTIRVYSDSCDKYYRINVENQGEGIREEEKELIFKRHYRSPRARAKDQKGVGIGLYISSLAMKKHQGMVELCQARNPTVFSMCFPKSAARHS